MRESYATHSPSGFSKKASMITSTPRGQKSTKSPTASLASA
jgi:hypothetical protein